MSHDQRSNSRMSSFLRFCHDYSADVTRQLQRQNDGDAQSAEFSGTRTAASVKLLQSWRQLAPELREGYKRQAGKCLDPVLSTLRPDRHLGSISEKLDAVIEKYIDANPDDVSIINILPYGKKHRCMLSFHVL